MGACHFVIAIIFARNEHQWPTHKTAGLGSDINGMVVCHQFWVFLGTLVRLEFALHELNVDS
jgi:hypothetical protein